MKKWVALFSQTGSEIVALSERLGRWPDEIFTNNQDTDTWHPDILGGHGNSKVRVLSHKGIEETLSWFVETKFDYIITLHGYLRILSPNICDLPFEIYNGHPAPIDRYPELKGKDPQKRIWQLNQNYPIIGSVVHRVVAGVDEGEIVKSVNYTNRCQSEQDVFDLLKKASLGAWTFFLEEKLK
jgi:methionyl-tRNA formyltransferase